MSRNGLLKSIYFPRNTSSSPSTNRPLSPEMLVNGRAHWYVAIICNIDNAKSRMPTPKVIIRTRTRSQLDKSAHEPIDLDNIEISPPESITPPIPSRQGTPSMAVDDATQGNVLEIPKPQVLDSPLQKDGKGEVIDLDDPGESDMAQNFHRMSISADNPPSRYNYKNDPEIGPATRVQIKNALKEDETPIRYTRLSTLIKDDLALEEDEPDSISSGLKQKYLSTSPLASRRTSGKVVPLDS